MEEFLAKNRNGENIKCIIIARFNFNNKDYILYTDNKKIYAGYLLNGQINKITDSNEFTFVNEIFKKLKTNVNYKEDLIELAPIIYNGELYKTIYDKEEQKRYFYHLVNNKYVEATKNIKDYLNSKYNKKITVFNYENHKPTENEKLKKRKKFIKLGSLSVMVLLLANPLIKSLINSTDLSNDSLENTTQITSVEMNNASEIKSYLLNNNNLSNDDIEFINSLDTYFNENSKYIDINNVKWDLADLNIKYQKDDNTIKDYKDNTSGYYSYDDKEIVILNANSAIESNNSKKILLHELTHAMSAGGFAENNIVLNEGMTEMLANEYLESYSDGYIKEQVYTKILCELVGDENIREAYFRGDLNMLANSLGNIYGTADDGLKFLSLINDEKICEDIIKQSKNDQEIKDSKKTLNKIRPVIDKYIKTYYEHKTNEPMEENDLMNVYMDTLRGTNKFNKSYENVESMNVIKQYFNTNIKDNNVYIEYFQKGKNSPIVEKYNYQNNTLNDIENKKVM